MKPADKSKLLTNNLILGITFDVDHDSGLRTGCYQQDLSRCRKRYNLSHLGVHHTCAQPPPPENELQQPLFDVVCAVVRGPVAPLDVLKVVGLGKAHWRGWGVLLVGALSGG